MIPIYERLFNKLPEYKNKYDVSTNYNYAIFCMDDIQEIIDICNYSGLVMQFRITRLNNIIKSISIDFDIREESIDDVRFLINDLNISDYQYNANYGSCEVYHDIKPYCLWEYLNDKVTDKLYFILDECENPRYDRPHVVRNPISLYDLDLKNVKSVCYNEDSNYDLYDALSIFKYVFIIDNFYNDTAYEMIDGKILGADITLFEFEVSIINSNIMTKSAQK